MIFEGSKPGFRRLPSGDFENRLILKVIFHFLK